MTHYESPDNYTTDNSSSFFYASASDNVGYWLRQLDKSLESKDNYENAKKQRIARLRRSLDSVSDPLGQYKILYRLFEEYKSYRNDSAMIYAGRCMDTAGKTGSYGIEAEARFALAFCQISAGIMNEAQHTLGAVSQERLDARLKRQYYGLYAKMWQEYANYAAGTSYCDKYKQKSIAYVDTMVMLTPKHTADYWMNLCTQRMRTRQFAGCVDAFREFQKYGDADIHSKAMTYAVVAWAFSGTGQTDSTKVYFAKSAICDNISCTREITALYQLASLIYKDDYDRASRYIHLALDDITFYDSRQRKIDLGAILPLIEQDRYEAVRSQRNSFMLAAGLFVVLLAVSLAAVWSVRRKNAKILQARNTISDNLAQLREVNRQLTEANKIKNEYIGSSFCANSELLQRLQKLFTTLDHRIAAHQYGGLRDIIGSTVLDAERDSMYAAFDAAFLKLFPDFIEKYNKLFEEKYRTVPRKNSLTSEMRIFALIRLGISDSERIANFLNYSVHTVNTYKTRVKTARCSTTASSNRQSWQSECRRLDDGKVAATPPESVKNTLSEPVRGSDRRHTGFLTVIQKRYIRFVSR